MNKHPERFQQVLVHTGQHYGNGALPGRDVAGVLRRSGNPPPRRVSGRRLWQPRRADGQKVTRTRGQRETRHYTVDVCITPQENTERPVTVTQGTNTVVGCDPKRIVTEALVILDGKGKTGRVPELWDGQAAGRIAKALD